MTVKLASDVDVSRLFSGKHFVRLRLDVTELSASLHLAARPRTATNRACAPHCHALHFRQARRRGARSVVVAGRDVDRSGRKRGAAGRALPGAAQVREKCVRLRAFVLTSSHNVLIHVHVVPSEAQLLCKAGARSFTVKHLLGTNPVTYEVSGWLKSCRENPVTKNVSAVLRTSNRLVTCARLRIFC